MFPRVVIAPPLPLEVVDHSFDNWFLANTCGYTSKIFEPPTAAQVPRPELRSHLSFLTRAPPSPEVRRNLSYASGAPPLPEIRCPPSFATRARLHQRYILRLSLTTIASPSRISRASSSPNLRDPELRLRQSSTLRMSLPTTSPPSPEFHLLFELRRLVVCPFKPLPTTMNPLTGLCHQLRLHRNRQRRPAATYFAESCSHRAGRRSTLARYSPPAASPPSSATSGLLYLLL